MRKGPFFVVTFCKSNVLRNPFPELHAWSVRIWFHTTVIVVCASVCVCVYESITAAHNITIHCGKFNVSCKFL